MTAPGGMISFRCTRRAPYVKTDCPGRTDTSVRQGYYLSHFSEDEVRKVMEEKFPSEKEIGFDIEVWVKPR